MGRRAILLTSLLVLAQSAFAQVKLTETGVSVTFGAKVKTIIKWLNWKQDVVIPEGALSDWNNAQNFNPSDIDSVAVLRLVTNVDVHLRATDVQPLSHPDNPNEQLATFICFQTDGDGSENSLLDFTGDPATGIPSTEYNPQAGIGPELSGARKNFVYIGGASTTAGTANTESWVTAARLQELSSQSQQQATYSMGAFGGGAGALGTAPLVRHVPRDGAVLIRVTIRALNGEDFGADSDDTEAPDLTTESPFTATLQLTALP